jgi:tRNA threonylcarbamoyladenosine biosynthesis protein TsaB
MITLTIRTDKPEAELGLFKDGEKLDYDTWEAHRQLAETIHTRLDNFLAAQRLSLKAVGSIIAYKGPGSFTGLRIGLSVANALADSLQIPIVGETGDGWIRTGLERLRSQQTDSVVMPEYGAPVHITRPKK